MRDTFQPTAYILATHKNGSLYTGVTSNVVQRIWEHREAIRKGHTAKYDIKRLVYPRKGGNPYPNLIIRPPARDGFPPSRG